MASAQLIYAIEEVLNGKIYLPNALTSRFFEYFQQTFKNENAKAEIEKAMDEQKVQPIASYTTIILYLVSILISLTTGLTIFCGIKVSLDKSLLIVLGVFSTTGLIIFGIVLSIF